MIDALVYLHITAGAFALATGALALFARKGEGVHRIAGSIFFSSMVVMCASAFVVAVAREQTINIYASTFTLYLIATSWVAARRRDGESGTFEQVALVAAAVIAGSGVVVAGGSSKTLAMFLYIFATVAGLAALLDVSVILRKGVSGAQRIARHLWRMTFAMFVATGSFFLGQSKFIPAAVRDAQLHFIPVILVVALLVYWLIRVLFTRWYKNDPAPSTVHAAPAEQGVR